jgi:hypothetical protein
MHSSCTICYIFQTIFCLYLLNMQFWILLWFWPLQLPTETSTQHAYLFAKACTLLRLFKSRNCFIKVISALTLLKASFQVLLINEQIVSNQIFHLSLLNIIAFVDWNITWNLLCLDSILLNSVIFSVDFFSRNLKRNNAVREKGS